MIKAILYLQHRYQTDQWAFLFSICCARFGRCWFVEEYRYLNLFHQQTSTTEWFDVVQRNLCSIGVNCEKISLNICLLFKLWLKVFYRCEWQLTIMFFIPSMQLHQRAFWWIPQDTESVSSSLEIYIYIKWCSDVAFWYFLRHQASPEVVYKTAWFTKENSATFYCQLYLHLFLIKEWMNTQQTVKMCHVQYKQLMHDSNIIYIMD